MGEDCITVEESCQLLGVAANLVVANERRVTSVRSRALFNSVAQELDLYFPGLDIHFSQIPDRDATHQPFPGHDEQVADVKSLHNGQSVFPSSVFAQHRHFFSS